VIVKGYGVNLRSIDSKDAEQIRLWRNTQNLQQYLHSRLEISYEQQQQWYSSINTEQNCYFIATAQGKDVGFCSLKNIDREKKKTEPGLFIADETIVGSALGVAIMLTLMDFANKHYGITHFWGPVLKSNQRAYSMYQQIGAVLLPSDNPESIIADMPGYSPSLPAVERARKLLVSYFKCSGQIEIGQ
jgi:RimJ/RimL family protein N-acetyltransferase